ncbi:hypothetical protein JCM10213_004322 [Rhodosporidiobolus nylandii]
MAAQQQEQMRQILEARPPLLLSPSALTLFFPPPAQSLRLAAGAAPGEAFDPGENDPERFVPVDPNLHLPQWDYSLPANKQPWLEDRPRATRRSTTPRAATPAQQPAPMAPLAPEPTAEELAAYEENANREAALRRALLGGEGWDGTTPLDPERFVTVIAAELQLEEQHKEMIARAVAEETRRHGEGQGSRFSPSPVSPPASPSPASPSSPPLASPSPDQAVAH